MAGVKVRRRPTRSLRGSKKLDWRGDIQGVYEVQKLWLKGDLPEAYEV
jgi:hypothetical protein